MMPKKMDFLLVGFAKAGTTTLDTILRENRKIVLPVIKETKYISNHSRMKIDQFWDTYYPNYKENKCIGGIEPTYYNHAKEVREVFGKDIKLIFMMRDPVKANYSRFKMGLRNQGDFSMELYRKYSAYQLPEMFEYYTRKQMHGWKGQNKDAFMYDIWIKEYLKYFNAEQMYFVLFEDFIKNPQAVIDGVIKFLEKDIQPIRIYRKMVTNEDKGISRNLICWLFNKCMAVCRNGIKNPFLQNIVSVCQAKCYRFTLINNKQSMNKKTESILRKHYEDTMLYISELLGKDLRDIWLI